MNRGTMMGRIKVAIREIQRKTDIDISKSKLPRARTTELRMMFQLEKLAREMPEPVQLDDIPKPPAPIAAPSAGKEDIMEVLGHTKGIGPALLEKIGKELDDVFPE